MYIATTYIGGEYTPGDPIPDDFPAEKLAWLIRAGAVRKAAPAPSLPDCEPEAMEEAEAPQEEPEADLDEIDEEAEAPEIDVMAGIVKDADEPEGKTKTASMTRAASKKVPKGGKTK